MTEEKAPINWRKVCRLVLGFIVGSIAAIQSYDHQRELAQLHGQHGPIGDLFPIIVDVLIVYATVAMDGLNRFLPRFTFWAGVGVTISANILAAPADLLSQGISAWAPIALLLVIENEAWRNKISKVRFRRAVQPAAEMSASNSEGPAVVGELKADGDELAISAPDVKPRTRNSRGKATAEKVASAAKVLAKKNPDAPLAAIAAKAGVSESTARRNLPSLTDLRTAEPPVVAAEPSAPSTELAGALV